MQADQWTYMLKDRQACRQAGGSENRQAERQTGIQTGRRIWGKNRLKDRQTNMKADQGDREG